VTDSETGITTTYYYDLLDRTVKYRETGGGRDHSVTYEYNEHNNLSALTETIGSTTHTTQYAYDEDNRISSVTSGSATETYNYDDLGRIEEIVTTYGGAEVLSREYTFKNPSDTTTSAQIATNHIQATVGSGTGATGYEEPDGTPSYVYDVTYSYTYDDNGNILSISDGTYTTGYVYDSANQLIRENNQQLGFTQTWEYDNAGNITFRRKYAYTTGSLENLVPVQVHEMSGYGMYGMGDLFAEYDGQVMSYDAIGNPLYDGQWTYTWEHGRELKTMSRGATTWTYTYDASGMRTQRTDGYYTYRYIYNGSQLSQMVVVYDDGEYYEYHRLDFAYSANGTPLTVTYNDCTYHYVTNIQGDVIAILDDIGRLVCRYAYDAWGNVTDLGGRGDNVGYFNPLRYRGYVYDNETGLYYLQSRYYNPTWCRFLNADALVSTGQGVLGNNMFAYCNNSPIAFIDTNGQFSLLVWGILAVGAATGGYLGYTSNDKLWGAPNKRQENALSPNGGENEDSNALTTGDRIKNALIGTGFGLGIGGLAVSFGGAIGSAALGSATIHIPLLGGTGLQTFARGALFYDIWAIIVAPFVGIEAEPIEIGPPTLYYPIPFKDNPRHNMY